MPDKYDRSNLILHIPKIQASRHQHHHHRPSLKTKEGTKLRTNSFSVVLVPQRSGSLSGTSSTRQYAKRIMTAPCAGSLSNDSSSSHYDSETDGYYSSSPSSLGTPRIRCTASSPCSTPRTPDLIPVDSRHGSVQHRLGLSHTPPSKSPSPFSLSEKSTRSINTLTEHNGMSPTMEGLQRVLGAR